MRCRLPNVIATTVFLEALPWGRMEYTKTKTITRVHDEQFREELLEEAIAQPLSPSQIKEPIRAHIRLNSNQPHLL
ncbi:MULTISPECIES: hypothetical protein [Arthrospira]|uniref:hypothetical protein n=1 Tax=Oscillatoriales TaxID=1150 RepID=UPI000291D57A|nr:MULTISPECIES: hypothetical protein [Arthrospira]MDT9297805.1 hypothetical protein [Arthrospira platensis PCC 7345]MDT9310764.1 hypothetical protein [Limnospira sp. Paracas R14]WAK74717.1 hypothetical protein AP9108_32685 [Arthrospira sp. PCC 9108]